MDIDLAVIGAIGATVGYFGSRIPWRRWTRRHRWIDDVTVQTLKGKRMRQNCLDCSAIRFKPS